jgi:hypothetical protein
MGELAGNRDSLAHNGARATGSSSDLEFVIGILQVLYGLVLALLLLAIVLIACLLAIGDFPHYAITTWACFALGFEANILVYFGLKSRKQWVVPLIVLGSVHVMISCLSRQPDTLAAVVAIRAVSALTLYQLWFFTRPATRSLFGADGAIVF